LSISIGDVQQLEQAQQVQRPPFKRHQDRRGLNLFQNCRLKSEQSEGLREDFARFDGRMS
jgi:hypothetical protein